MKVVGICAGGDDVIRAMSKHEKDALYIIKQLATKMAKSKTVAEALIRVGAIEIVAGAAMSGDKNWISYAKGVAGKSWST